jgi:hypothetical protein
LGVLHIDGRSPKAALDHWKAHPITPSSSGFRSLGWSLPDASSDARTPMATIAWTVYRIGDVQFPDGSLFVEAGHRVDD